MASVDLGGVHMEIKFDLFGLKQQLQLKIGEEISWSQIAREADLHRNTVERIGNNQTERVDLTTLAKLLLFFQARGMNTIGIEDIFVIERTPTIDDMQTPAPDSQPPDPC